jgi:GTP-binding protein Era
MLHGVVVITGKPNVGKSTFINNLLNKKIVITSPKPQTTRDAIGVLYRDEKRIVEFIDTPGYHIPHNKLDIHLNTQIINSYKRAEASLLFIDLTRPIDNEDEDVIKNLQKIKIKNIIIIFTKYDLSSDNKVETYKQKLATYGNFGEYIVISNKTKFQYDLLLSTLDKYLTNVNGETLPTASPLTDNFTISEIVREQVIFNTKQELPYSTAVIIDSNIYDKASNVLTIHASIIVEKESQKPIIIGAKGSMIKKIGTIARKELLKIFNCAIVLKLFVKVEKDWRNNSHLLKSFGYKDN